MRFEYLIGMRYLRARRRERFVSLIAAISLAGVALGTFALTVVLSVMSGFQEDLRQRLLAFNPHVTVESSNAAAADLAPLMTQITALPGVEAAAPYVSSQVMAVSTNAQGVPAYVAGGVLRGVVAANNPVLTELTQTLKAGGLDALERTYSSTVTENGGAKRSVQLPGAIIGDSLALELGVRMGDPMVLISPASLGGGIGAPRLKRFVIGGLFHSGMYQFDASLIFVSLKQARALLADDPQLESGLEVGVGPEVERPLRVRHRHRREERDLLGQLQRTRGRVVDDLVDEAELQRDLGPDDATAQHPVECACQSHEPCHGADSRMWPLPRGHAAP